MPRPGGRNIEKSKDFFGSMRRLLRNLKPWRVIMILALILAMISAILSLIAPNKLSDFTDTISKGLIPKTEKLENITTKITNNLTSENLERKIKIIMTSKEISNKDKEAFQKLLLETANSNSDFKDILQNIPESILIKLLEDIKIDNNVISAKDQLEMLKLFNSLDKNISKEEAITIMDKLPKSIYNVIKPTIDMNKIESLAILMASIYIISALFSYIQNFSMTTVSNNFAKKLRSSISKKINKLPLRYFDSHETGDVLSRVTNDVDTIAQNLNNSLATLVTSITLFLGSILMMFITNWIMALTAIISSLTGFVLMFMILGKSQKYFIERQKELGNLNGYIEEIYSGHNIVKVYNGGLDAKTEFNKLNKQLYNSNQKSQFLSGLMPSLMSFVGNFGYVAVCIVGALLTLKGNISFGVIVAFMMYVRLFTSPLSQIAQATSGLQSATAASERVYEFLDEEEMNNEKNKTLILGSFLLNICRTGNYSAEWILGISNIKKTNFFHY